MTIRRSDRFSAKAEERKINGTPVLLLHRILHCTLGTIFHGAPLCSNACKGLSVFASWSQSWLTFIWGGASAIALSFSRDLWRPVVSICPKYSSELLKNSHFSCCTRWPNFFKRLSTASTFFSWTASSSYKDVIQKTVHIGEPLKNLVYDSLEDGGRWPCAWYWWDVCRSSPGLVSLRESPARLSTSLRLIYLSLWIFLPSILFFIHLVSSVLFPCLLSLQVRKMWPLLLQQWQLWFNDHFQCD